MRRRERELVEVVFDRLDLAVVAHLKAEAEEGVLDHPPHLGDRVQVADRERLAGERDVDDLVPQAPVELSRCEQLPRAAAAADSSPSRTPFSRIPLSRSRTGAQRLSELRLAAEHADAHGLELRLAGGRGDRGHGLVLVRLRPRRRHYPRVLLSLQGWGRIRPRCERGSRLDDTPVRGTGAG